MMSTRETPQLPYQRIIGFRIWYSDGSTYSSTDGDWKDAPVDDVQVVMVYFEKKDGLGRYTRLYSSGCDYYAMTEDSQFTSSFDDISAVTGHILYGKFMNYEQLLALEQRAFNDYGEWLDG